MKKLLFVLAIASFAACKGGSATSPAADSAKMTADSTKAVDSTKSLDSAKKVVDTAKMKVDSIKK